MPVAIVQFQSHFAAPPWRFRCHEIVAKTVGEKKQSFARRTIRYIRPYVVAVIMQGTLTSNETSKQGSEQDLVGVIARRLSHNGPCPTVGVFLLHHDGLQSLAETLGIRQFVQKVGDIIKRCVVASPPRTEQVSLQAAATACRTSDLGFAGVVVKP
ncbi:hypothetical protein J3458_007302 [Metarhizium acridum]|uniref:uncharacterized protein n=1 Tax=Metarhizium acridum TaxID=92637 RepID=UPI001C6B591A|nr:hypothetical protein J3458_007302 [Metarhizium acridum]